GNTRIGVEIYGQTGIVSNGIVTTPLTVNIGPAAGNPFSWPPVTLPMPAEAVTLGASFTYTTPVSNQVAIDNATAMLDAFTAQGKPQDASWWSGLDPSDQATAISEYYAEIAILTAAIPTPEGPYTFTYYPTVSVYTTAVTYNKSNHTWVIIGYMTQDNIVSNMGCIWASKDGATWTVATSIMGVS